MNKALKVLLTTATALAVAGGITYAAHADETPAPSVNPAQVIQLRDSLTALGVDAATQDQLVYKFFVLGQRLDGDTDAAPVSQKTWTDAAGAHTSYTYADGSKSETVIEQPKSQRSGGPVLNASGPSASGCSRSRAQDVFTFTNCAVAMSRPTYQFSFNLSYLYRQFGCDLTAVNGVASGGLGIDAGKEKVEYLVKTSWQHTGICHARVTVIQTIGVGSLSFKSTVGVDIQVQSSSNWGDKLALTRIDQ